MKTRTYFSKLWAAGKFLLLSALLNPPGMIFGESAVDISDPSLEVVLREALGKPDGSLTCEDLMTITELSAGDKGIVDLTGLECAKNLRLLNILKNQVTDLTPISSLSQLEVLIVSENEISALKALSALTNLVRLDLRNNKISDIRPLRSLSRLERLLLGGNQIHDLTPLRGMTGLWLLGLSENRIDDLNPLKDLTNLIQVGLRDNYLTDISPLLEAVSEISSRDSGIFLKDNFLDLSEGSSAKIAVDVLSARVTRIGYGESVVYDPQRPVEEVSIPDEALEGLLRAVMDKPDGNLTNYDLAEVREIRSAEGGGIANLGGLEHAVNLRRLELPNHAIADLSPIGELVKLNAVDLAGNPVDLRSGTPNRPIIDALIQRRARLTVTLEEGGPPVTFPFVEDLSVALDNGAAVITWSQEFAVVYQAQQSADLVRWSDVPTPPAAEPGEPLRLEVEPQSAAHAFYRVLKSLDPDY